MLLTTGKVDAFINNPYLDDTRNWFVDRRFRRTKIRGFAVDKDQFGAPRGKMKVKNVAELSLPNAHLLTTGLQMLDYMVYESQDPKNRRQIEKVFLASDAAQGWEVRTLPSGKKHIVRITDEIVLTYAPMDVTEDEVDYINQLPWMMQYMLDR